MNETYLQKTGRWVALIFGCLLFAFFAMFGIAELFTAGEPVGVRLMYAFSHIVMQGGPVLLVTWLAWKKPFWGGIAYFLLTLGAFLMFRSPDNFVIWIIYITLPLIGLMLLSGNLAARQRPGTA